MDHGPTKAMNCIWPTRPQLRALSAGSGIHAKRLRNNDASRILPMCERHDWVSIVAKRGMLSLLGGG